MGLALIELLPSCLEILKPVPMGCSCVGGMVCMLASHYNPNPNPDPNPNPNPTQVSDMEAIPREKPQGARQAGQAVQQQQPPLSLQRLCRFVQCWLG